jgi:hypothetical protein
MEPTYLIWSNEHVAWWAPDSCGYTVSIERAGRYSRTEAIDICKSANFSFMQDTTNPDEIPVLESDAVETMTARPYKKIYGQRRVRRVTPP